MAALHRRRASEWIHLVKHSVILSVMLHLVAVAQQPPADTFDPTAQNDVLSFAVDTEGRILVGGRFTYLDGIYRGCIGRFSDDGALDLAFDPRASSNGSLYRVGAIGIQPDGRIVVGGLFLRLGGLPRTFIGRLHPDGSIDAGFDPGAQNEVYCLAIQPDGKILVGGAFTSLAGQARSHIGRLNPDGSLDTVFAPDADRAVHCIAVQPDGKILVGGVFDTLGGANRRCIGRLLSDGTVDGSFNPGASNAVYSVVLQPDGKILAGGSFRAMAGQTRVGVARLNADGSLDNGFVPQVGTLSAGVVRCLCLQTDGGITVGGVFSEVNGQSRTNLARLNADGTIDTAFNPGVAVFSELISASVQSLTVQPNGRILVGGRFQSLSDQTRTNLGRLFNVSEVTTSLSLTNDTLTWMRQGSGPEVWRASFDYWSGSEWSALGDGARVAEGWQLDGLALAPDATIRARGFTTGGLYNGSSWFIETQEGPLIITEPPVELTKNAGNACSFTVSVIGGAPRTYQWYRDGVPLAPSETVSGVSTSELSLTSLRGSDSGDFFVTISNAHGVVTSLVARLDVLDPFIAAQSANQFRFAGQDATFVVAPGGTPPLTLQWRKEGNVLIGETNATLTLTNVFAVDAGTYDVVISNAYGTVTSTGARLSVVDPFVSGNESSQTVDLGEAITFGFASGGTPPLSYQWSKDGVALSGATNSMLALSNAQASDAGFYELVVTNLYGSATGPVYAITVNLATLDSFNPGANWGVHALALQADRKIVVGGDFIQLGGQTRLRIGRLHSDGAPDDTFHSEADNSVNALAIQTDGRLLAGGTFTFLGGVARGRIGRLNSDGTPDLAFNPSANDAVYGMALLPDDRIVLGGNFTFLAGQSRSFIGRLETDGSLDATFDPSANGPVFAIAPQPDGKLVVAGAFTSLGGQSRSRIARLNADGTVDAGFDPAADGTVYAVALQRDGQILVGGRFSLLGGQARSRIGRLNPNGTLDMGFDPGASDASPNGAHAEVSSLGIQADGKILVGGRFTMLGGQARSRIGRLHADGTLDMGFDPAGSSMSSEDSVSSLVLQADGKILVGGNFKTFGGLSRFGLARLNNSDLATQTLDNDEGTVTWMRGGSSPEVWRTVFEASTNQGAEWFSLGEGTRIDGGWQATGPAPTAETIIRARGFTSGGRYGGSSWFLERVLWPIPMIVVDDGQLGMANGYFGFNVRGGDAPAVVIEASTNLIHWQPVHTNVTDNLGKWFFHDLQTDQFPQRYYRIKIHQGPLAAPVMRSDGIGIEGQYFRIAVSAAGGQTLVVDASTNLIDWQPILTNTVSVGPLYVHDPAMTNFTYRFYRAREVD